jgi:hypothetical protein
MEYKVKKAKYSMKDVLLVVVFKSKKYRYHTQETGNYVCPWGESRDYRSEAQIYCLFNYQNYMR